MKVPTIYIEDTDGLTLNQQILFNKITNELDIFNSAPRAKDDQPMIKDFSKKPVIMEAYITNNPFKNMPLINSLDNEKTLQDNDKDCVLTEKQFNLAMHQYRECKNKYLPLFWHFTSKESKETIFKIILAENGYDRFKLACELIENFPSKDFPKHLQQVIKSSAITNEQDPTITNVNNS